MVVLDVVANRRIRLLSHGQLLHGLVNTVVGKGPTVRVGDNHPRPSKLQVSAHTVRGAFELQSAVGTNEEFWRILDCLLANSVLRCSHRSYYLRQLILQIIFHHQINKNISLKVVPRDRLISISSLVCISDFQGFRYLPKNRIFCLNSWPSSATLLNTRITREIL
jgi:hypothetical protein